MVNEDAAALIRHSEELAEKCADILHGHSPNVQGAVLMDLVSLWLAGHNPGCREEVFEIWLMGTRALIPVAEQKVLHSHGFENWDEAAASGQFVSE